MTTNQRAESKGNDLIAVHLIPHVFHTILMRMMSSRIKQIALFAFAENLEEKRTFVGTIGATGFEDDLLLSTLCDRG